MTLEQFMSLQNQKNYMSTDKNHRIVFIGGHQRTLKTFKALLLRNDVKIILFIIQKDYENEFQYYIELENLAKEHHIPYEIYESAKRLRPETIKKIKDIAPDVILRGGNWRAILPSTIWSTSRHGCIGLHGSALPEYRGWAGINWHIINGEKYYGLQMFKFNENIDDGDLVCRNDGSPISTKISLDNDLSISQILDLADQEHVKLIMELLTLMKHDQIKFSKQDITKQTWTCHRGPNDGEINWKKKTHEIYNFIRGQSYPFPGAFTFFKGLKLYIWKSRILKNPPKYVGRIPGKIIKVNNEEGSVQVLTGDGILIIEEVSYESADLHPQTRYEIRKKANDYLKSPREKLGLNIYEEFDKIRKYLNKNL